MEDEVEVVTEEEGPIVLTRTETAIRAAIGGCVGLSVWMLGEYAYGRVERRKHRKEREKRLFDRMELFLDQEDLKKWETVEKPCESKEEES